MFEKEITFDRFIRGLMVVAGLGLAIYIINLLSAVLLPFFIAWFLAYMIYPTVKFFQYKLHLHNRILCIAITLLLILAAIAGFFWQNPVGYNSNKKSSKSSTDSSECFNSSSNQSIK